MNLLLRKKTAGIERFLRIGATISTISLYPSSKVNKNELSGKSILPLILFIKSFRETGEKCF
jgi:hypothetical protein